MDLQIEGRSMATCKHAKRQAKRGRKLQRFFQTAMLLTLGSVFTVAHAGAQSIQPTVSVEQTALDRPESSSVATAYADLPDAPSTMMQERPLHAAKVDDDPQIRTGTPHIAPIHIKFIPAGWVAQPLTPHDKVILGARNLYAPFSIAGYVLSAGYSHLVNGQPNYGTNSTAFAKRLGAAVVRDTTEGAFTDMVFAPLLHEDPRYYVEGRKHGYVHRVLYAMTRPLITRTDSGRETLNGALLLGQASASALSYTYYPQINKNFHDTAATFGGSLAGSAIDDVISEFSGQFLKELHLRKSSAMPR